MKTYLTTLIAVLVVLGGCKKENPEADLPPATQFGANTGGFLLNGMAYLAEDRPSGTIGGLGIQGLEGGYGILRTLPLQTFPNQPYELYINSERAGCYATVTLYLRKPRAGEFALNQNTGLPPSAIDSTVFDHATINLGRANGGLYVTDAQHTGRVVLTRADRTAGLSAGTFEFTAVSLSDPTKTVRVSSGRFDRKED